MAETICPHCRREITSKDVEMLAEEEAQRKLKERETALRKEFDSLHSEDVARVDKKVRNVMFISAVVTILFVISTTWISVSLLNPNELGWGWFNLLNLCVTLLINLCVIFAAIVIVFRFMFRSYSQLEEQFKGFKSSRGEL